MNADVRDDTMRSGVRASALRISSASPSANHSWLRSWLKSANGKTAMDLSCPASMTVTGSRSPISAINTRSASNKSNERQRADNEEIQFASCLGSLRLAAVDILFELDSLGCQLKRPGGDQGRDQTYYQQQKDQSGNPFGQPQYRYESAGELQQKPGGNQISDGHAVYVALF